MKCPNCGGYDNFVWSHPERCHCVTCSKCGSLSYWEDSEYPDKQNDTLCAQCYNDKHTIGLQAILDCRKNHLDQCSVCREYIKEWGRWPDGLPLENNLEDENDQYDVKNHCYICRVVIDHTDNYNWPDGVEWEE